VRERGDFYISLLNKRESKIHSSYRHMVLFAKVKDKDFGNGVGEGSLGMEGFSRESEYDKISKIRAMSSMSRRYDRCQRNNSGLLDTKKTRFGLSYAHLHIAQK
jgi:hypothetical protein